MFSATPNLTTEVLSLKLIYLNSVLGCVDPEVVTPKSGVKSETTVVVPSIADFYTESSGLLSVAREGYLTLHAEPEV